MQYDQKQLLQIAVDYPWWLFTGEEISVLCNVSRDVVTRVRAAKDSPFRLNKCRPEWFTAWMLDHPDYQQGKALIVSETEIATESCARSVKRQLTNKRLYTKKRERLITK